MRLLHICILGILLTKSAFGSFTVQGPEGWEKLEDPSQLPGKVKVVYVGSGKWRLTPSINVSVEESPLSQTEYSALAAKYHAQVADTKVTKLGPMATKSGEAEMLQVDRLTGLGHVRFIQAIVKREEIAYVITATCLQEEFGQLSRNIFQCIQSFALSEKK